MASAQELMALASALPTIDTHLQNTDYSKKNLIELEDMLTRVEKLLRNTVLMEKLKDKGAKVKVKEAELRLAFTKKKLKGQPPMSEYRQEIEKFEWQLKTAIEMEQEISAKLKVEEEAAKAIEEKEAARSVISSQPSTSEYNPDNDPTGPLKYCDNCIIQSYKNNLRYEKFMFVKFGEEIDIGPPPPNAATRFKQMGYQASFFLTSRQSEIFRAQEAERKQKLKDIGWSNSYDTNFRRLLSKRPIKDIVAVKSNKQSLNLNSDVCESDTDNSFCVSSEEDDDDDEDYYNNLPTYSNENETTETDDTKCDENDDYENVTLSELLEKSLNF